MKGLLLVAIGAVLGIAGCSSAKTVTLPPPSGNFTNASLKGQYAYSMSGQDASTGAFIARIGSFTADGSGSITAATEDVINTGAATGGRTVFSAGGTYAIQPNGRGVITLIQNSTSGLGLSITLTSASGGLMIQTDYNGSVSATSSGSFSLQNAADFSAAGISNNYVFSVSGVEATMGAPIAMMGQITTDGAGTVQSGVIDINNGAAAAPDPPAAIPAGGSYGAESTNPGDLAAFGRGAVSFNGSTWIFYIVDHTHFLLLEEDASNNTTFGDAFQQRATIPTQLSNFTAGDFAFLVGGASVIGTMAADARVGRFTTDGGGNLSNVFLDENYGGNNNSVSNNVSAATYTIDTSAIAQARGRGTLTFTQSTFATFEFVFYLISPTQAVALDESAGLISSGIMAAQTGSAFNSSLAGNYVFNWSGVFLPSSGNFGSEEDFVGQYSQSSSGTITGAVDFMEIGTNSSHGPVFLDSAVSGSLTLNSDPTTRNDYQVTISTTGVSPGTIHFKAYIANSNTIFLVSTGSDQVLAGTVIPQP